MLNAMKAIVKWEQGMNFKGKAATDVWVPIGPSKPESGPPQAATPMELLLMALGACTAMDVVHILGKKRIAFEDFWVELDADKTDTYPIVYSHIKMKFIIVGKVPKDAFEQAVTLSAEKYCSVGAMVGKTAEIIREIEIREK
ncbi:MAG: OsmC family protein [Thermoplasmata archaeon]|nr:OsmC family protein [Thermoplasmata archaeon]